MKDNLKYKTYIYYNMNQPISSKDLDNIREQLIRYEDIIINKYIECMENRHSQLLDIDSIVEELNKNINESYHFVISDLLYYYYDNHRPSVDNKHHDMDLFQLIKERILLGEEVIKAKYASNPEIFIQAINEKDTYKIHALLENKEVEEKILNRILGKNISPKITTRVHSLYKEFIIPYTKKVQVVYCLMNYDVGTPS